MSMLEIEIPTTPGTADPCPKSADGQHNLTEQITGNDLKDGRPIELIALTCEGCGCCRTDWKWADLTLF